DRGAGFYQSSAPMRGLQLGQADCDRRGAGPPPPLSADLPLAGDPVLHQVDANEAERQAGASSATDRLILGAIEHAASEMGSGQPSHNRPHLLAALGRALRDL